MIQFADGPVSGAGADAYSQGVLADGLSEGFADLDGKKVLFLRGDQAARVQSVLVFIPIAGGYRYIGDFAATCVSVIKPGLIQVYEACGGHFGFIKTYRYDNEHFVCLSSEPIAGGDGAPDENNLKLHRLFSEQSQLRWSKVPNHPMELTESRAGARASVAHLER